MSKRLGLLLALILFMLPLTGCWDRMELEQRGFVTGIAVDEGTTPKGSKQTKGKQTFRVTFQEVIPAGLKQTGQSGSSLAGDSYFNIAMEGNSILSVITKMSSMTSRTPFFEHLKIVVISEKVARTKLGFANVLDYFLRNNDARRSVAIMIAKGDAKQVLDTMPQGEKTPVIFIQSISKNQDSFRMVPETRIGDLHEFLLKKQSFIVQKVTANENFISLIGAAVMNGATNNLSGFLDETETEGYNFIADGIKSGVIEVNVGDNLVVYKIDHIDRSIYSDISDPNRVRFTIELHVEGSLLEAYERLNYLDDAVLNEIQENIKQSINNLVDQTINKAHKQLKKDVLGLGNHLEEHHPKFWKTVYDEWDNGMNYFARSEISVVVRPEIRRIGSINNSEQR
ncbi:Ger(x)C family spore germination protein [Paenibacillus sp. LHD-117]|uniref:Ger(x)C family spore germination protein n=1 Tax=Paenibacillus sp. LHD-117 TaxID=3071412 RepID=UPI0027E14A61|nr:Ger(x)C family spore germination protein [Paenibacillus sp. LHD-117]MDQ6418137.1 Ger(x)C family spore germination protein [Paenibacillus sp. LHD-117]